MPPTVAEIKTAIIDGNGGAIQGTVREGISDDMVTQMWDGETLGVTIARQGSPALVLSSDADVLGDPSTMTASPVRGVDYNWRSMGVGEVVDGTTTLARFGVDWHSDDATDYLAGGYWLSVNATDAENPSVEVGAFMDGPEFDTAPTLPLSGTATYEGRAQGLHTVQYVPGEFGRTKRDFRIGEFDGDVTLTADFANLVIGGWIDNIYSTEESSSVQRPRSTRPYIISLGQAPIDSNGGFTGSVGVSTRSNNVASSEGGWNGQFSGVPVSGTDRNPRLVGGTFGTTWVHTGGTTGQYVGSFYAGKN